MGCRVDKFSGHSTPPACNITTITLVTGWMSAYWRVPRVHAFKNPPLRGL